MHEVNSANSNKLALRTAADAFLEAGADFSRSNHPILRLTKGGVWVAGADKTPIAEIQFAANVQGASRGWTCFRDGAVVDEKMVLVSLGRKISPEELADHGPYDGGDGWHLAVSLQLRSMRTGQECLFKSTSLGGRAAFGELLTTHGLRLASGDSGIPVIELGVSHYTHRRYGLVYEPSFKVVGWLDESTPARRRRFRVLDRRCRQRTTPRSSRTSSATTRSCGETLKSSTAGGGHAARLFRATS